MADQVGEQKQSISSKEQRRKAIVANYEATTVSNFAFSPFEQTEAKYLGSLEFSIFSP